MYSNCSGTSNKLSTRDHVNQINPVNIQAWDRKCFKKEEDNLARERIDSALRERTP